MSYAHDKHYECIERAYKVKCSDLGKQVANILGYVGRGIYNAPFKAEKVDWSNPQCIEVNWEQSMANWDGCYLTNLIIECHRRMVRVSIGPNMRTMKIQFWQRKSRSGSMSERLPDIEEMVKSQDEQWGRITTTST
jgi:hypothetical protein